MTLVCAGAGSGKTLAVASWLAGDLSRDAVAWLTVDSTDNDVPTFWSDVLGALALSAVLPADSNLRELVPAAAFGASEALRVRAGLAELPVPVVLVLDDVQELTNAAVLDSLSYLIAHQPPNVRLVLVSRSDPPLRLHRARLSGGVVDIRSQELAFTETEAGELFERSQLSLTGDQVQVLLARTQGWAAGLRLATLSLGSADLVEGIARFDGAQGSVAEYLLDEVLDRVPAENRDFLLRTSVAERLSASLATALSGRSDSQLILERLVRANAFVTALGGHERLVPLPPPAARPAASPVVRGTAGCCRRSASAGRAVVHRPGRADPGAAARDAGPGLGRGRAAADQHRAAVDRQLCRAGTGRRRGTCGPAGRAGTQPEHAPGVSCPALPPAGLRRYASRWERSRGVLGRRRRGAARSSRDSDRHDGDGVRPRQRSGDPCRVVDPSALAARPGSAAAGSRRSALPGDRVGPTWASDTCGRARWSKPAVTSPQGRSRAGNWAWTCPS